MDLYFLRFSGTDQYVGVTKSGERVRDEKPIHPDEEVPRIFYSPEEADATRSYRRRHHPNEKLEIVRQPYEWIEPTNVSEEEPPEDEESPATEEPPEAEEPQPGTGSRLLLQRVPVGDGETVLAQHPEARSVRFRMGDHEQIEKVAPFSLFGDTDGDLRPGKITGPVTAEALDKQGNVLDTATL